MSKLYYPAIIDREGDTFGVTFPDLPGCVAAGESPEQAMVAAEDALALHLDGLAGEKATIPNPSELQSVLTSVEGEADVLIVTLIGAATPTISERVNVWLPKILIQRIDQHVAAEGGGASRSAFLAAAARQVLGQSAREKPTYTLGREGDDNAGVLTVTDDKGNVVAWTTTIINRTSKALDLQRFAAQFELAKTAFEVTDDGGAIGDEISWVEVEGVDPLGRRVRHVRPSAVQAASAQGAGSKAESGS